MTARFVPPLHVFVVYHGRFAGGPAWATAIRSELDQDDARPLDHGRGVPVYVSGGVTPPDLPLGRAARAALLLLVDDEMVADRAWRDWADAVGDATRGDDAVLVLRLALTEHFLNLGMTDRQAVRLEFTPPEEQLDEAVLMIALELHRVLEPDKTRVFVSHAKRDGRDLALALKSFVEARPLERFFDEVGILADDAFEERLELELSRATLIALVTDAFSSRYWCQWEVVRSKGYERPFIAVEALARGERRRFPYIANVPTLRWDPAAKDDVSAHRRVLAGAMLESLRCVHARLVFAELQARGWLPADAVTRARPPEMATVPATLPALIVHPEPPLPDHELALLRRLGPVTVVTPTQAIAGAAGGERPLDGMVVALSISDPPAEDMKARLLTPGHLNAAWVAFARHVLAAGARPAYGGDLRRGGYTEILFDLVRAYGDSGAPLPRDSVVSWLSWPLSAHLTAGDRAGLPSTIDLRTPPAPPDVELDPAVFVPPTTPERRYAWTRALAIMRDEMAEATHARVLLGGQLRAAGAWPGLAEEAWRHLRHDPPRPIYLVGAYGGMTAALIEALEGGQPEALTAAFQLADDLRRESFAHYNDRAAQVPGADPCDFAELTRFFHEVGVEGLDNGLDPAQNRRLFVTTSLVEQVGLVLEGLRAVQARGR